jgi:hypothetical protein
MGLLGQGKLLLQLPATSAGAAAAVAAAAATTAAAAAAGYGGWPRQGAGQGAVTAVGDTSRGPPLFQTY